MSNRRVRFGMRGRAISKVMEGLHFLEPVAQILEGAGRSVLDPLPPEHREFALEVLKKFEAKEAWLAVNP